MPPKVWILVRGPGLAETMSRYLIDRIAAASNVEVLAETEIVELVGAEQSGLRGVTWRHRPTGADTHIPIRHVFQFLGAHPQPNGCRSAASTSTEPASSAPVPMSRRPARAAATRLRDQPGSLAVGDVRYGSVKRVGAAIGEGANVVAQIHGVLEAMGGGCGESGGVSADVIKKPRRLDRSAEGAEWRDLLSTQSRQIEEKRSLHCASLREAGSDDGLQFFGTYFFSQRAAAWSCSMGADPLLALGVSSSFQKGALVFSQSTRNSQASNAASRWGNRRHQHDPFARLHAAIAVHDQGRFERPAPVGFQLDLLQRGLGHAGIVFQRQGIRPGRGDSPPVHASRARGPRPADPPMRLLPSVRDTTTLCADVEILFLDAHAHGVSRR